MINFNQKKKSDKITMTLQEFLKKHTFGDDYEYIVYYIDLDGKKMPFGVGKGIQDKNILMQKYYNVLKGQYHICKKYDIHKYNVAIIDIDEDVTIDEVYEKYDFLKNTLIVPGNSKGFHIWVFNDFFIETTKMIDELKHFKGDLITDTIWEKEDKICVNDSPILTIKEEDIIKCFGKLPCKPQENKKVEIENKNIINNSNNKIIKAEFDGNYEELEEIVENIPKRYSDKYDDWVKIISILRKYDFYDLAKSFSKKSKKYDDLKFEDDYNNKTTFTKLDIGSIYHYSKDNKTNFDKIKKKYLKIENTLKLQGEYEKMETEFNINHFKVINKSLYCKIDKYTNDLIVMKKQTLSDSYSHLKYEGVGLDGEPEDKSFIGRYTSHTSINPRIYTDMDFYANMDECPNDYYNLWTDFDAKNFKNVETDEIGLEFILNHIKILCNHQEEVSEYFLDFLAHMLQRPWEKSVFIMFLSKEGTGKDLFISLLKLIIGQAKYFETPNAQRDVFGDFNAPMLKAFLVNLSELEFLNTKGALGKFKQFITGDNITINGKGKDQIVVKSYHRYIGTSNELTKPIITKEGDRRNLLIACSNEKKGDDKYFSKLAQYVKSKNVAYTFYKYLMERPDADIFINKPIPKTEYQETIKEHYEDNLISWLKELTEYWLDDNVKNKKFQSKDLYSQYKTYLEDNFSKDYKCTLKQFSLKIKMFIDQDLKNPEIITITKPCNKVTYNINFELLLLHFGLTHRNCLIEDTSL